jgi:hypothetical protein
VYRIFAIATPVLAAVFLFAASTASPADAHRAQADTTDVQRPIVIVMDGDTTARIGREIRIDLESFRRQVERLGEVMAPRAQDADEMAEAAERGRRIAEHLEGIVTDRVEKDESGVIIRLPRRDEVDAAATRAGIFFRALAGAIDLEGIFDIEEIEDGEERVLHFRAPDREAIEEVLRQVQRVIAEEMDREEASGEEGR